MTIKELFSSVTFDEVATYLLKSHPDVILHLLWYRIDFDMLCQLTPKPFERTENDAYKIINDSRWGLLVNNSKEDDLLDYYDEDAICLSKQQRFEHFLAKEVIIESDVKVSNAELAALCLIHMIYYSKRTGIPKDFEKGWEDDIYANYKNSKRWSKRDFAIIRSNGGYIPSFKGLPISIKKDFINRPKEMFLISTNKPMNKIKRKKRYRREVMTNYYFRMLRISAFIINAIPYLSDDRNNKNIDQLCKLFYSDYLYYPDTIASCSGEESNGAKYLCELLEKIDIPRSDKIIIILTTGEWHKEMTDDEKTLCKLLIGDCISSDVILSTDPSLGSQVRIDYATFNSDYPLVK